MQKMMKVVRLSLVYGVALILVGSYPLSAMAEAADTSPASAATTTPETTGATPTSTPSTTTTATPTATSTPTPSSTTTASIPSSTTPATTTDSAPSSTSTPTSDTPAQPKETYTYNPATRHWDSNIWQYNPTTGKYERTPQPVQTAQPSSLTTPSPVVVTPNTTSPTDATGKAGIQPMSTAISDTTKNAIANAINSGALSGDATVKDNTRAGNATTGDALAAATVINNVNSTVTNSTNQKAATFVSNVMGDVHGDILLQPTLLKAMLEAGAQTPSTDSTTVTTTNQLTNNINLDAQSGNATVSGNTNAGSATTGNANTVADVLNIVNSMVSANRSFVGTINIYGNLDGDILVAPDFIPQMLANNGTANTSTTAPTVVSSQDTQSIVNNVALAAQTGKAAVTDNTTAGNATTGNANTNVVLFNLTGHEIVASNSLLVFVNVLGKWVGVIVDAPAGATAAAIGNGVTTDRTVSPDLVINAATNTLLTNNINLTSRSGDALVTGNTRAGNATTGNATASANIGNIVGTQMGLSDWFGVLFINVFGTWNGSFGIDTSAGNPVATIGTGPTPSHQNGKQPMRVIEFVPHHSRPSKRLPNQTVTIVSHDGHGGYTATDMSSQPQARLTSAMQSVDEEEEPDLFTTLSPVSSQPTFQLPWLAGTIFLAGLSLVGASKLSDIRKRAAQLK